LSVSAIFPFTTVQSFGKRAEKLPFFNAVRVFSKSLVSNAFEAVSFTGLALAIRSGIVPLDGLIRFFQQNLR